MKRHQVMILAMCAILILLSWNLAGLGKYGWASFTIILCILLYAVMATAENLQDSKK